MCSLIVFNELLTCGTAYLFIMAKWKNANMFFAAINQVEDNTASNEIFNE